jgi:hypothetical protein
MIGEIEQTLIELMADFLDSDLIKYDQAIVGCKDPEPRETSELHIRMAQAAFNEYKKTIMFDKSD